MNIKGCYLLSVLLLLVCSPIISLGATVEKEFKDILPFVESGNIYLENVNGNIEVKSWTRAEVEVKAFIKVKAGDAKEAEATLGKVEILIDKSLNKISIEVDYPKKARGSGLWNLLFGRGKPVVSTSFWLTVPKKSDLDMNTTNGKVEISDIEGKILSRSTNGSVYVRNVVGSTESKTTNGNISAVDLRGDAVAKTTNGKINMRRIDGRINAKSTNGEIYAEVVGITKGKDMEFITTNGSVKVLLPKDINADLEAKTNNGRIYTEYPITMAGEISKKHITGKLNDGGPLIYIETTNGGIEILESKSP
jgi:DUF4097 and DUF4098 domain-containing protein YvlB